MKFKKLLPALLKPILLTLNRKQIYLLRQITTTKKDILLKNLAVILDNDFQFDTFLLNFESFC